MIIGRFQQILSRIVFTLEEKYKCSNKSVFSNQPHLQVDICRTVEGMSRETLKIIDKRFIFYPYVQTIIANILNNFLSSLTNIHSPCGTLFKRSFSARSLLLDIWSYFLFLQSSEKLISHLFHRLLLHNSTGIRYMS
jgi:hypothetical protein